MKKLLFLIPILLLSLETMATPQIHDRVIYRGVTYDCGWSKPMQEFFDRFPEKRPRGGVNGSMLWRGYIATYEIVDDRLYVNDIEIMYFTGEPEQRELATKSVLKEVFPDGESRELNWWSGLMLVFPNETQIMVWEFKSGVLTADLTVERKDYTDFTKRQMEIFRKDEDAYNALKNKLLQTGRHPEESLDDDFLRLHIPEILVD